MATGCTQVLATETGAEGLFTHDSIALGEDGSTHQPVEQLAGLRAVPELIVIRPGDANETAVAWRVALQTPDRPVALVLTRQNLPTLDRSAFAAASGLERGAYVLADAAGGEPDVILIASGSEVGLIVAARQKLLEKKIRARIVSMPSWELFELQPQEYRDSVLPPRSAQGWRSRPARRRAGIATSAAAATCSPWIASALRRPAK